MKKLHTIIFSLIFLVSSYIVNAGSISQSPLFLSEDAPPIVMLTMGRDHKLYYEAYNDASDLNDDGVLDIRYKPSEIDYFGYFDSYKCYNYASGKFTPSSQTTTKKCSGNWSGDFLNYVTTSRIDALRKVLYGGYRSTDSTSSTVLKRAFIPQDAHSWGKQYTSTTLDGYDISDYTPLSAPVTGKRHLFANVSLSVTGEPLMRVIKNSQYRIWEWVSIERPVTGTKCLNGNNGPNCRNDSTWQTVPASALSGLTLSTYSSNAASPQNPSQFDDWYETFVEGKTSSTYGSVTVNKQGSMAVSTIESADNPFGSDNNYTTIIKGKILIPETGNYTFAIDGDDAVEFRINDNMIIGFYDGHGYCNCTDINNESVVSNVNTKGGYHYSSGPLYLTAGEHDIEFRHQENSGGEGLVLRWNHEVVNSIQDYNVNVDVCVAGLEESNCKAYSDGSTTTYKPTGLLQRYGDDELMSFGLITGSYQNNMRGGVLRKNIASFQDEIDLDTGIFSNSSGIIDTIDKLRIARFNFSNHLYSSGFIKTREINNGEAQDWGNPIAEMMYEGLRYFTGKTTATPEFVAGVTSGTDGASLGLPEATWLDPYRSSGGADYCATPVQLVISDVNTSYDSDHLPGAYFPIESGSNKFSGDISDLNVSTIANEIWSEESEASNVFIGQSKSDYDGSPSPKSVDSFASIRGHAPEEATKQGSFYSASIAKYGQRTDLRTDLQDNQNMDTLAVALASPLPRIEVPINSSTVTIVPFAKSVSNSSINSEKGQYQPTNQIVDFFVETIANTGASNKNASINAGRPYGKFRINFEADEQAADHDMDAIVEYEFLVNASNELIVNLDSIYAAAGTRQHIGYVISGTTKDGTYLEVRDADINDGDDTDYFLDTPPGVFPGGAWEDSIDLPLTTSRTFTVGTTTSASFIKHDPLWYAAKWASEERVDDPDTAQNEEDGNDTLDQAEWDSDNDGVPDGYFLVTNAGKLAEQLQNAFSQIVSRTSSSAAAATNSKRLVTSAKVYQARFNSTEWFGELLAFSLNSDGAISTQDWNAADRILNRGAGSIITPAGRDIFTYSYSTSGSNAYEGTGGLLFNDIDLLNDEQQTYLNTNGFGVVDGLGSDRINYLRGDQSKEKQNGGSFRNRSSLMGDIVNSDPWFSGQFEDFGYSLLSGDEGDDYSTFRNTKLTRTPALFFGANDGMLHAINADKGYELFTFVPAGVYSKLSKLTSEFYGCTGSSNCLPHEYFVDGAAKSGDVYINQDSSDMTSVDTEDTTTRDWATVLVSTLGAGGQGLFALDVTTPSTFTSSNVLWEISTTFAPDSSDLSTHFKNNLGYTLSQASIVRMYDGSWAAIVANGYDSNNNTAALYVIDIKTGKVIADFYTQVGSSSEPNGMSTPIAIDYDGDKITDTIYAGDLQGNLWKIDVKDTNPNKWKFAFKSGNKPAPFFKAVDADGVAQPITSKPQVGVHPKGGLMVYFGTGKYFETGDDVVGSSPQIQTFYGVRDEGSSTDRSKLQEQTIVYEANNFNNTDLDIRVTSDTQVIYSESITGWYIDLKSPNLATNAGEGERVVSAPLLRAGRIIFVTLIPESDPCGWGGTSWLMEMDAINGARLNNSPLDIDGDGDIDTIDMIAYFDSNGDNVIDDKDLQVAVSGVRRQSTGIIKTPGVMSTGNDKEVKYVSGSSGALDKFTESSGDPSGRQSWRQIK